MLSVGQQVDVEVCHFALKLLRKTTIDAAGIAPLISALEQAAQPQQA